MRAWAVEVSRMRVWAVEVTVNVEADHTAPQTRTRAWVHPLEVVAGHTGEVVLVVVSRGRVVAVHHRMETAVAGVENRVAVMQEVVVVCRAFL